jgi:hypothetical protein
MARSKHNKLEAAPKPIKPAQTTSKKKTLKKQIKTEGASQATPAMQVPEWQDTEDCKITKQKLACDGSCPIGGHGFPYWTRDQSNFKRHMKFWHGDKGYGSQALKFPVMTGACRHCNYGFETKQALLRHYGGKYCLALDSPFTVKIKCDSRWWPIQLCRDEVFNVLAPHPAGNRFIGRRWRQDNQEQTLEPLEDQSNWGMPLLAVMVSTAIPFMDRDAADYKEHLDQKNFEEGPPRLASRVMCHYQDMLWQGAFCCSGSTVLTRERVVSKLMLDMVCMVEAIHFNRDGSMHLRNEIDGEHDMSMTPDVCVLSD